MFWNAYTEQNMEKVVNKKNLGQIERLDVVPKFRYEKKFTLTAFSRMEVLHLIKTHPALFREIFYTRQINNIYFDTPGLQFYKDNLIGIGERKKVRIRWYGATFGQVKEPVLEFKIKHNTVGDKWSFKLPPFRVDRGENLNFFDQLFESAALPPVILNQLEGLKPSLLNSYQRTYFRSVDRSFRLTLDEKMTYFKTHNGFNTFLPKSIARDLYVLELKYNLEADRSAAAISHFLQHRLNKHSKYVNGIDQFL